MIAIAIVLLSLPAAVGLATGVIAGICFRNAGPGFGAAWGLGMGIASSAICYAMAMASALAAFYLPAGFELAPHGSYWVVATIATNAAAAMSSVYVVRRRHGKT